MTLHAQDFALPQWAQVELRALRGRVAELEKGLPFHGRKLRKIAAHKSYCNGQDYCGCPDNLPATEDQANLICSDIGNGLHKPVIDLDLSCELVPSAQRAHYHLYINHIVQAEPFFNMLDAMADAGVVERGYANASRRRGYAAVRHPDKPKELMW